jgi:glucokinase
MDSLGIDIGGTSVKLAMARDGKALWTGQSAAYFRPSTQQLIAAMREASGERTLRAGTAGLCVPGLLDTERRMITLAVNVPGVMNVKLDEIVARAFGEGSIGRVELINDAVAAATDYAIAHQIRGRLLAFSIGTGVGAAVLDDGRPLLVEGESPGHIGQIDVSLPDAPAVGPDGGEGSLEAYLGAGALRAFYGERANFIDQMKMTDPSLRALVRGLRICHAIYRPNHIALLGGIGIRLPMHIDAIRAAVGDRLTNVAQPGWQLGCGQTDFHAALGAARLASAPN